MDDQYTFTPIENTEAELRQISEFLRLVFPHARHLTPAYLRWLYVENPHGPALGFNAHLGRELVGHVAGQPLAATLEGLTQRGIFLLNAAVHPRHMRRNISRRFTDPLFEAAARQGYSFMLGMGNSYSTLPLLTRFELLGPLDARIGVGLPRCNEYDFTPSFATVWNEESLRWRLSNPERRYSVQARGGRTVVTTPAGKWGIGAIVYEGGAREAQPEGRNTASGPLKLWIGRDPRIAWARSPYLPIPMRLRPSPLNLVFKDLTGRGVHPDPARVLFQAIDFDAY